MCIRDRDGQLAVQRGEDRGGEFFRAGFGGPQLVHEQHVAAAAFEGCHAQRVEAFRGERAAVEQEIVRSGRCLLYTSQIGLVGPSGLEPPTLRLSVVRSSQLSYGPVWWR